MIELMPDDQLAQFINYLDAYCGFGNTFMVGDRTTGFHVETDGDDDVACFFNVVCVGSLPVNVIAEIRNSDSSTIFHIISITDGRKSGEVLYEWEGA